MEEKKNLTPEELDKVTGGNECIPGIPSAWQKLDKAPCEGTGQNPFCPFCYPNGDPDGNKAMVCADYASACGGWIFSCEPKKDKYGDEYKSTTCGRKFVKTYGGAWYLVVGEVL